jgi:hypothetical protein
VKGFLKCSCETCGGHIEFPGHAIDSVVTCPHCSNQTTLRLDVETEADVEVDAEPGPWRKLIITTVVLVVLTAVTAGAVYYVRSKAQKGGLRPNLAAADGPAPAPATGSSSKTPVAKKDSSPALPAAPEHVVDPDPAKHRFPIEAARRAPAPGEIKSGREVYLGHCSECHVFYDPSMYTAAQWTDILGKMAGKAKLGRDDRDRLTRFTQSLRSPEQ